MKTLLSALFLLVALPAFADEVVLGPSAPSSGGGSGLIGWPSLSHLGGSSRPTQALIVDTLNMMQRGLGPGRDDNGSLWGDPEGVPTGTADNVHDFTYPGYEIDGVSASYTIALDAADAAFSTIIGPDIDDPQAKWFCRDNTDGSSTRYAHQIGTANDEPISELETDKIPFVMHDESANLYRLRHFDFQYLNCVTRVHNSSGADWKMSNRNVPTYSTTTSDTLQPMFRDGVHFGPYGSRWFAQRLLLSSWEDQYPAILGVSNLIADGEFESDCSAFTLSPSGSSSIHAVDNVDQRSCEPFLGGGCDWTPGDAGTATTATISGQSGEFFVGSISINLNAVDTGADSRTMIVKVQDNAGNNIAKTKFWIDGEPTGGVVEEASVVDSSGTGTPGQYAMQERMCYGGCTIKFAFQLETGDTGFKIQAQNTQSYPIVFDELWVRRKVYQDLDRHYLIADGAVSLKVFTDSRGDPASFERFTESLDYMLGYETDQSQSRTSLRPNLYVSPKPTSNQFFVSGERLGNFVGPNDGNEDYSGAAISRKIEDMIGDSIDYCVALYGVNDQIGGSAREGFASSASDAGNEHLYFADQVRGFEQASEKSGCIPLMVQDHMIRVDTNVNSCHAADGSALNCGTWQNRTWADILHNGLPDS